MTARELDLSEVLGNLTKLKGVMLDAGLDGLRDGGEHILQVAGTRVPLDHGDLDRSGVVSEDRARKTVAVSYDTEYAVEQHENTHIVHKNGRQAKYLETAHAGERGVVAAHIQDKIKRVMS